MEDTVVQGYKFYRPLYRDYITSVHAKFVPITTQESTPVMNSESPSMNVSPTVTTISNMTEGTLNDFLYLENTYHLDEEDGLLYKTICVAEEYYRKLKERFIVGYRQLVMPNGVLSDKCDNEPLHIRDIERMTLATDSSLVEALIPVPVQEHAWPPQGEKPLRNGKEDGVKKGGLEIRDVSKGGREAERVSVRVHDAPGQSSNSRMSGRKR